MYLSGPLPRSDGGYNSVAHIMQCCSGGSVGKKKSQNASMIPLHIGQRLGAGCSSSICFTAVGIQLIGALPVLAVKTKQKLPTFFF